MSTPTKDELPKVPAAMKDELTQFDSTKMKHAETQEKNPLPSKEDIAREKGKTLIQGIETFDSSKLKPTETQEKNPLPTKEVIDQEKTA